ncbi:MAG: hypothetical protein IKL10_10775 [Clostridia bacterium]|nr:hypothetical protein [Clostridia bacterium]
MSKKSKMKCTKKTLPLFLSLILLVMSTVVAFAVTPVSLSEANVTVWPTASGEIYFGQKISDGITLNGGEVQYEGVTVSGSFEFTDTSFIPTSTGTQFASLKFVPEDSSNFLGFTIETAWDVTYTVNKTTPVLVDENNVPVATEVEAGAKLSTSILSGGQIMNPYYPEEPKALAGVWKWAKGTTIVNESGYYEARITVSGYERLTAQVYVKIASDIPETTISEYPTISELTYNPNVTWGDIELTGGKAIIKGTDTEVEGTFTLKDRWLNAVPNPNITELEVVFTPVNAEEALPVEFTIPVKVNPLPISFNDGEGNFVVDGFVYKTEPGTQMSDIEAYFKGGILNYPPQSVIGVEDRNSYAENGRTYKLTVIHDNPNYVGTELYFTVAFNEVEFTPTIAVAGNNKFRVDCGNYSPDGTFTITCNGKEIAEVKAGRSFDCVVYTDEGGTYEITAKYNPVENDYFTVNDASYSITVNPARNITTISGMHFTVNGSQTYNAIRTGDVIELNYTMPEFAYFVVKDGSGKTVTLDGVDLTSKKIKFTMPDCDLDFTIKTPAQLEQEEATANCKHLCHSENPLVQMIWKLLHIIFRLFNVQQFCDCGITHYDAPVFGFFA